MKERHFRLWKKLACGSKVATGGHRASTTNPCVFHSRMPLGFNVPMTETCCERLEPLAPFTYTERVKFRSKVFRSSITCPPAGARLLFTSPSINSVSETSAPGRDPKTENKTNLDYKTKPTRKPAATARRPSNQKVRSFFVMN